MTNAAARQAYTLISYFKKKYKDKYGVDPKVNRYKSRWGFDAMLMDMDMDEAKGVIDYYFQTVNTSGHTVDWFLSNYEKLAEAKENTDQDALELKLIREATKKRAEEWRNRHGDINRT